MKNIKRKIFLTLLICLTLLISYLIFTPFDGMPASVKIAKIQYFSSSILSEIFNLEGDSFKDENEEFGNTYRLLHVDHWVETGLEREDIESAFNTMRSSKKPRYKKEYDTVSEYGPGNWVYEFEQFGDRYFKEAKASENNGEGQKAKRLYIKASMYYKVAAFPGITREWNPTYQAVENVYKKCLLAYEKYGQFLAYSIERVTTTIDGTDIFGYLHLPQAASNGSVPLVVLTNGTDFFMTELYSFTEKFLDAGFGVFVFDIPGIGASHKITLKPGVEGTNLHRAFLSELSKDSRIDNNKIGLFGKSLGGNVATRLAFTEESDTIKFVVNMCGPVDGVSQVPIDVLRENFPAMTFDALLARFSDAKERNEQAIITGLRGLGLIYTGLIKEGIKTRVPILSINTQSDPANPIWEMKLLTKISQGGEMIIADGNGHCPANENPEQIINWIQKIL